ncbi:Alpha/Beta hydrolase protein [Pterulicium gracile]|uniref:Carboxylic ester hydrolase n=1 Tax=Pterulicium gracile TaxID=1884261 RepID=A0A5C3Q8J5_9AGAR|nr:Alpha/Beta hydrolase protein [Pterula gracilis]
MTRPGKPSVVDLSYATYQGVLDRQSGVTNFLGVRYAANPTGRNRFKAPQPPPRSRRNDVQPGDRVPASCLQAGHGQSSSSPFADIVSRDLDARAGGVPAPSEDCLFLNVHVPGAASTKGKKLPVVVWFHGGGYASGNGSMYDGSQLVRESNNQIIAVVVQYRLGLFGFLAGDQVERNGSPNAGLLDQEFALKWVQNNIAKFGGDKNTVTIWGQSAGAGSVLQHIVAHKGKTSPPLFQRAIASSPYLPSQYKYNDPIPKALYADVVKRARCERARDSLACLRSADVSVLQAANVEISNSGLHGLYVFAPVIDGKMITQSVTKSLKEGRTNGAALLSVANANEGLLFVDQNSTLSASDYTKALMPDLCAEEANTVAAAYEYLGAEVLKQAAIVADSHIVCPAIWATASFSKGKTAYKGKFTIAPAMHLQDLSYYFNVPGGILPGIPNFDGNNFRATFSQSFLSFAIAQDPNVGVYDPQSRSSGIDWPKFRVGGEIEETFGQSGPATADIKAVNVDKGQLERCRMWEGLTATTRQ